MRYLITGGCGFLGSNLSQAVMKNGGHLTIFDNLSRLGSEMNLAWLKKQGNFSFFHGDIRNQNDIDTLIKNTKPDVIFHLAGQVAMTTSLKDPQKDFEINAMGSLYLLESVRKYARDACVIYSSTNKVYGDLGPALIIVHGLFGSLDNWAGMAKRFSEKFKVYLVELHPCFTTQGMA